MATIKTLTAALAEANLQIATLRVELAETTKRSADNAHWASIYRQQRDAARKANGNVTNKQPSDYAARKAAAIAEAQRTGEAALIK